MAIRKRNGRWEYRFAVNGQNVAVSTGLEATARNQKKAGQMEAAHRQAILEGRWGIGPLKARFFADALPEFIAWCKVRYEKPNSWRRIETSMVSASGFFGKRVVSMIAPGDIERYKVQRISEHRVKPVTVKHDLDNLSVFFRWAVRSDYARQNPVKEVDKPSDADAIRQHVLTPAEEALYFLHAKGTLHDVARLILLQGMRPEEVMSIAKADVDLDHRELLIPRGKTAAAKRRLRLTQESATILARRVGTPGPWIFPSRKKPGAHLVKLNGTHDRVCEKTKLGFVLYDLRHTFATRLAEVGVDAFAIAAILGHSSTRVLSRYIHPTQAHQDAAMVVYDQANEGRRGKVVVQ